MIRLRSRDHRGVAVAFLLACGGIATQGRGAEDLGLEFFEKKVRPILTEHCYKCHSTSGDKVRGGLLLDSRDGMIEGGETGAAVVPGDPGGSLLIAAIRQASPELKMPPRGKLTDAQVADLETWIEMGAPDPRRPSDLGGSTGRPRAIDIEKGRDFWSFRPIEDHPLPAVRDRSWPRRPVDCFLLAKLEGRGMRPSAEADRRAWIRRATYDLTGLPPTPDEVRNFLDDGTPDAHDALIERLLASPHYGERWGRHWLDVVRYADTSGCNADVPVPDAYRYRNYVIDATNRDKPFDQFVREQVAGDLLPANDREQLREQLIATGYLAISRRYSSLNEEFHLTLEDSIDNIGKAFLGLSISCARCHDHKFDPIPTTDYYALYGILESTRYAFPGTEIPKHSRDLVPLLPADECRGLEPLRAEMDALDRVIKEQYGLKASLDTGEERTQAEKAWKDAVARRDDLIKDAPRFPMAFAVAEGEPHDAHVQKKGDPKNPGEAVPRRFLRVLGGQTVASDEAGSGRRDLADWLTDPRNPLTARVMVNRIWQHHFGQGLVRTPNDFGARGASPTHPELLDFLAARFIESGWSLKAMHRLIMQSAAYRMGGGVDDPRADPDPNHETYRRFRGRRLDAEEIRDAMLAVNGALDRTPGGPHPFPPEWEWKYTQHRPFIAGFETDRRGVYLVQQRIKKQPFLDIFDGADTNATTGQRAVSTTAIQALFLMNDPFAHAQADLFAARVLAAESGDAGRIGLAHELAFARPASPDEVEIGTDHVRRCERELAAIGQTGPGRERAAWASYLRVLMSSNEFVFVD